MRLRPFSWVIIGINLLFLAWMVSSVIRINDNSEPCPESLGQATCDSITSAVTGFGVVFIGIIWAIVDVILLVLWIVTRGRYDDNHPREPKVTRALAHGPQASVTTSPDRQLVVRRMLAIVTALVVIAGGTVAGALIGREQGYKRACSESGVTGPDC